MSKAIIGAVYVIWLDSKVEEMDNAMYQHMKDEFNEKVMKNGAGE